ncbi:hypothetical protein [Bacillus atrophaeus]|uniref:hypothetical protein n=1 Tax=Bacillus atrophaeus TaxID=1452 RepID=UPI00227ED560|nr:hypothetical protein [Bacillus atrophaeus]MCY8513724.1 hypothetical protein [Bacillus atrophaeus]MCY8993472.1 hypothetical protein [Bacillus atrophaeus]
MDNNTLIIADHDRRMIHLIEEGMLYDYSINDDASADSYSVFRLKDKVDIEDMDLSGDETYFIFMIGEDAVNIESRVSKDVSRKFIDMIKTKYSKLVIFSHTKKLDISKLYRNE